jgi:hypothetical protein
MSEPDYASWYTKAAAAERLAVSTKTVEQLAKDGQLPIRGLEAPNGRHAAPGLPP